ncbi:Mis12 protein-domain-containing protein [Scheffersomyces xylosifermentans]|uniref:Mis12 protein-domain-containing protein n=1 Tax=Scheffersomyces xylosifermentans TaxID=1304137 RepID=UPI00315CC65F
MTTATKENIESRVTALLTEHFGFPPITLVDEVINAVNEIMYKCTGGVNTFLKECRENALNNIGRDAKNSVFKEVSSEEIEMGTAKLETLLEMQVDRNFDKFELYTLRNIFVLPHDLVEEGWVKLKHHEGIEFSSNSSVRKEELDEKIKTLVNHIKLELQLRKILKLQIIKARKVIKILRLFKKNLEFLSQSTTVQGNKPQLSAKAREALKSLSPIDETFYFLLQQVDELISQTRNLSEKVNISASVSKVHFLPSLRDRYIDSKSIKILEKMGFVGSHENSMDVDHEVAAGSDVNSSSSSFRIQDESVESATEIMNAKFLPEVSMSDIETVKAISQSLNGEIRSNTRKEIGEADDEVDGEEEIEDDEEDEVMSDN